MWVLEGWLYCMLGVVWAYYDYLRLLGRYSSGNITTEGSYLHWPY